MSRFTDYGENALADWVRGETLDLPSSWYIAPGSAASDSSFTEIVGADLARFPIERSLINWAGTQNAGTTLVSFGTSHETSNNVLIDMGIAASDLGIVTHVGFFDASVAGNCWMTAELLTPIATGVDVPVSIAIGDLVFTLGLAGGMSDYLSNKLIDKLFRGQAYDWPASVWLKAFTEPPTNAGGGVEVGGGLGYERVDIASTLLQWSGTQGPTTTVASSGTSGRISNNAAKSFPDPIGPWGNVGWAGLDELAAAGNPLFWGSLANLKTVGVDRPLIFAIDSIGITWA